MKTFRWLALGLGLILASGGAYACIEALTLDQMVMKTDVAIHGTVTGVRTVQYTPPGDDRLIFTLVTVEGSDLFTGEDRVLEAAFLGGTYQGDSMLVTSMPAPSEYSIGNEVVVFSGPVEGWGPDCDRCIYAAMGGIYRVHNDVVFGKGEGFAIESNQRMDTFGQMVAVSLSNKRERNK